MEKKKQTHKQTNLWNKINITFAVVNKRIQETWLYTTNKVQYANMPIKTAKRRTALFMCLHKYKFLDIFLCIYALVHKL